MRRSGISVAVVGCADGEIDDGSEWIVGEPISNSRRVRYYAQIPL